MIVIFPLGLQISFLRTKQNRFNSCLCLETDITVHINEKA